MEDLHMFSGFNVLHISIQTADWATWTELPKNACLKKKKEIMSFLKVFLNELCNKFRIRFKASYDMLQKAGTKLSSPPFAKAQTDVPLEGAHRFVLLLFKQTETIKFRGIPAIRTSSFRRFDVKQRIWKILCNIQHVFLLCQWEKI